MPESKDFSDHSLSTGVAHHERVLIHTTLGSSVLNYGSEPARTGYNAVIRVRMNQYSQSGSVRRVK